MSGAYLMVQESQDPLGPIDGWWKQSFIRGRYWYLMKDAESGFRNSLWVNVNSLHKPIMYIDVFRGIWKLRRDHLGMANCWEALEFRDTFAPSRGQWSKMAWYEVEIGVAWSMKMWCFLSPECAGLSLSLLGPVPHVHDALFSFLKASPTSFEHL